VPPEIVGIGHVVKVVYENKAGGGKSAHCLETGIEIAIVMSGEEKGKRTQKHCQKPGYCDKTHPLPPVQVYLCGIPEVKNISYGDAEQRSDNKINARSPLLVGDAYKEGYQHHYAQAGDNLSQVIQNRVYILAGKLWYHFRPIVDR
jgi:hypothetical protein